MKLEIKSLRELNLPNLENATIVIMLNASADNYNDLLNIAEYLDLPETIIAFPKRDAEIEKTRRSILAEINKRCKKRYVGTIDSIVICRIINGKANFNPKRAVNVNAAIANGVFSAVDELINLTVNCAANSFDAIDREFNERISESLYEIQPSIGYSTLDKSFKAEIGSKKTIKNSALLNRVLTK